MKRKLIYITMVLALMVCLSVPAMAAEVVQGRTITYDKDKQLLTIEEYDTTKTKEHPYGRGTGKQMTFNLAIALIGATPDPGNIVRIAYQEKGAEKIAVRVMNVTKQDLMKK
ncbi:MAG: hypothetical protein LDL33_15255 [Desulfomonile sp.]|nr:hypothetical protein [Desulfomonile sp.]